MYFEFIDNITRADVAIRAHGQTCEELFCSAANALISIMVENYQVISREVARKVEIENNDIEMLFFNFLNEFLFYKDSENLFLLPHELKIFQQDGKYILHGKLLGEKIDPRVHNLNVDVKAVTMHHLSVKKEKDQWVAVFVLDV